MSYKLKEIKIRINNTEEDITKITELWQDIMSGKLPLLYDSNNVFQTGVSPISKYSNYKYDEKGDYDLSILTVTADFFADLELAVSKGLYKKYTEAGDVLECVQKAWQKVWTDQNTGKINRAFTEDFESTVPKEFSKDGQAHCYLYIAVK